MPELPEVETVKNGLIPVMEGRRFTRVILNRPDLRFPFPPTFISDLTGARVERLDRRAKFLNLALDSGQTLSLHLGMSGTFKIHHNGLSTPLPPPQKHDHVVFHMDGANNPIITYHDPRRFGFMELADVGEVGRSAALGPEPLSNSFNAPDFMSRIHTKTSPIKTVLLDQRIVAGLGNIYVCEALFGANISPLRKANTITEPEAEALCAQIKTVLTRAIAAGGSSLKDFKNTDGDLGYFQHSFAVYDREGTDCPRCNEGIQQGGKKGANIVRVKQSGRSSFYCPACQQ